MSSLRHDHDDSHSGGSMRNRLPFIGATTLLTGLLAISLLPLTVSCSGFSNPSPASMAPLVSGFYVTNNPHDSFTSPQTSLTITKGDSVYLLARYATTGSASIAPGNLSPASNAILPVGVVNQDTVYTLTVANGAGSALTSSVQVKAVDAPDATITAPAATLRGITGLTASVPNVVGSTYVWTVTNGTVTAGAGTSAITFTAGSAGTGGAASSLTVACKVTNAAGLSAPLASKQVVVNALPPTSLTYVHNPVSYYVNVPIPTNTPTVVGADPVQGYTVTPALPAGLVLNAATGLITGAPTAVTAQGNYVVTATNSGGSTGATVALAVLAQPAVNFTASPLTIGPAGGSILTWSVDATVANITVDQGVQTAPLATTTTRVGSFNVSPAATTTYTLTANLVAGGSVSTTAKITVDTTPLAISSFTADATLVPYGNSTNLHWTLTGTPNTLTLDGASVYGLAGTATTPVRRHTYTLNASNSSPAVNVSSTKVVAARGLDLVAGGIAGAGASDNANAALAQLNAPRQIAADAAGNIYVADGLNHTIRMFAAAGGVTTLAGNPGVGGFVDGTGATALFNNPRGIAVKADGSAIYVYDASNKSIRAMVKGASGWTVSTIPGTSPIGNASYGQITLDPTGNFLVVADSYMYCIRVLRLSDNTWGLYSGISGGFGTTDNTTPALAKYESVEGVAFNKAGTYFYVSEYYSTTISRIRMVPWIAPAASGAITAPTTGTVITIAGQSVTSPAIGKGFQDGSGSTAYFSNVPASLSVDANDVLWMADTNNHVIRKIVVKSATPGDSTVSTVAGTIPTGTATVPVVYAGAADGAALSAKFNSPNGVLCVGTKIYVSDTTNAALRMFDGTNVATVVGALRQSGNTDATGAAARFNAPQGVATYGGFAYVADTTNNSLRKVALSDGTTTTLATGFTLIKGVAVDTTGRVYVTDSGATAAAKTVQQIAADGTKTTIVQGLSLPQNLTVSPVNPNLLYVVDNNAILEVTVVRNADGSFASASITNTIGLAATGAYLDGAPATARFKIGNYFAGLAVDGSGNIFVADEGNSCIRKIAATTYTVSTVAGVGAAPGYIDTAIAPATLPAVKFNFPNGLVIDPAGNVYVADQTNNAIRKIATDGTVSSLIGQFYYDATKAPNGASVLFGATPGAIGGGASLYKPYGLAITAAGDLLVITNDGLMQITAP